MSSALNTALVNRLDGTEVMTGRFLTAQQVIAGALASDSGFPAVFFGNFNQAPIQLDSNGTRKPVITYRPSSGSPDLRFRDDLIVDDPIYDLEIWTFVTLPNLVTDIAAAVQTLIERRSGCPALPVVGCDSVWAEAFVLGSAMYDAERNGWFLLTRYRFIEARN
jgi:hypothetical protein